MFAAASGRTACASTSAGMTRPVSGGVKKLRGPDTVRAQLKVEDPDEVAGGRLAEAVRAMPAVGSVSGTCTIVPEPRCRMYGSTAWLSHSAAPGLTATATLSPLKLSTCTACPHDRPLAEALDRTYVVLPSLIRGLTCGKVRVPGCGFWLREPHRDR